MKIFECPCFDGRKSFYGKALIIERGDGIIQLQSYNTIVAEIVNGVFRKVWDGSTQTTNRHIKSFKKFYNLEV